MEYSPTVMIGLINNIFIEGASLMRAFFIFLILSVAFFQPVNAKKKMHAISMHNDVKYPEGFKHFDGVNPKAPKGGILKIGVVGTFDSTNPYITKGTAPLGLSRFSEQLVFESLMARSPDEPFTLYGWVAESIEIAPDRSWIIFYLNSKAKWEDGTPITPQDVIFTHETLKEKGVPNMRIMYSKVDMVEQIGSHSVKFTFKPQSDNAYNPELPLLIALMPVLPRHFLKDKDFEKTSLNFVMGSGPYKITKIKPGHRIDYERRDDYWGKDLPVNVGKNNFNHVEVEYYRDPNVARIAFENGEYDYLMELIPGRQIYFKKLAQTAKHSIKTIEYEHGFSIPLTTYCMNGRRDIFKDRRVREALSYAFDFHWLNKNLFHGTYKRHRSFFENTKLAHKGPLSDKEYKLLKQFKCEIPEEVFEKPYYPANYKKGSNFREGLKIAKDLLKDAGWKIQKGTLKNVKTGKDFSFELILYNKEDEKVALSFLRTLKKLGIKMSIRTLDPAQYEMRRLKFDYDMILNAWFAGNSPGAELYFYWGSAMADQQGSRNYPAVKNRAVDFLCKYIASAKTRADLVTGCHALDRVLMWGHYVIPLYYNNHVFIAHRDTIEHPEMDPKLPVLLTKWWAKPKK